jgi:hypothetical protein
MRQALDAGATRTPAVALLAERDALDSVRSQFHDEVIALREF